MSASHSVAAEHTKIFGPIGGKKKEEAVAETKEP